MPDPFSRRHDDALVRLVRHEQIEIVAGEVVALQQPLADLAGVAHRELEDRLAVLLHVVQPLVDGLVRRRHLAAARRHAQRRAAVAVDHVLEIEDADIRRPTTAQVPTAPAPSPNSTQVARSV